MFQFLIQINGDGIFQVGDFEALKEHCAREGDSFFVSQKSLLL